jgi:hypothetical protein
MPSKAELLSYSRGYAAGVRRGRRVAKFVRAEMARLKKTRGTLDVPRMVRLGPMAVTAPVQQPDRRARLHIIVPGPCQGIDVLWERELDADDLEMARDQIVAVFNRWIKAKQDQPRRSSAIDGVAPCPDCGGTGQVFGHADEHSCTGKPEPCASGVKEDQRG